MKLVILDCETKQKGSFLLTMKYGDQELIGDISVHEGVVTYVEYSDNLQKILHKDVGEAKNMNKFIFKIYRDEVVDLPTEIGDF